MGKSITFLMTGSGLIPSGGYKVIYEYANRFANDNYDVHIVYPASLNLGKKTKNTSRIFIRYIYWQIKRRISKKWFPLNRNIKQHYTLSLDFNYVPKTDYYVATGVHTSYKLYDYDVESDNKFYLIQGFENWEESDDFVYNSYKLGLNNIVISNWLHNKVKSVDETSILIPNGFDFDYFKINKPIETRNPLVISMLYNSKPLKGCNFGLEALEAVKQKYSELNVLLFGVERRPSDLPEWMNYYQLPDKETHNKIYNESAIFLAPSLSEGWGLTVGEAMICGAAIVCTNTMGFQEMVEDGKSALISPIKDSKALADNICKLIENPDLRINMAKAGLDKIMKYTWDSSYEKFKTLL